MKNLKKKIGYLGLFFLLFIAGGNFYTDIDTAKAEMTVYVTPTGSKYHTHKCGNGTYTPASLSSAQARGLTPCKKCFGNSTPSSSSNKPNKKIVAKPIKINKTNILLVKGQTYKLKISNATSKVSWSSSKKSVVKVSASGKVTAKGKGKAIITAKVGEKKKICRITVEAPKLSRTSLTLKMGESKTISLSGCRHSIRWLSSDSNIAEVSKGKIKAVDIGNVTIKAIVHGKKYNCKVKVKKPDVKDITISKKYIEMECDSEEEIEVSATPEDIMDYYSLKVTSSNPKVVSVDSDDSEIVYLNTYQFDGEADITITIGNVKKVCHVKVNKPAIEEITLRYEELEMEVKEEITNWYTITPFVAEEYYEAIWKSENENIVKVYAEEDGNVQIVAVGVGETNIILTLGDKSVMCHVIVREKE